MLCLETLSIKKNPTHPYYYNVHVLQCHLESKIKMAILNSQLYFCQVLRHGRNAHKYMQALAMIMIQVKARIPIFTLTFHN